jgi:hypothetical protein
MFDPIYVSESQIKWDSSDMLVLTIRLVYHPRGGYRQGVFWRPSWAVLCAYGRVIDGGRESIVV